MPTFRNRATGATFHVDPDHVADVAAMSGRYEPVTGMPARSDTKAAWVEWAVTQGADFNKAQAATKNKLQEQYG